MEYSVTGAQVDDMVIEFHDNIVAANKLLNIFIEKNLFIYFKSMNDHVVLFKWWSNICILFDWKKRVFFILFYNKKFFYWETEKNKIFLNSVGSLTNSSEDVGDVNKLKYFEIK